MNSTARVLLRKAEVMRYSNGSDQGRTSDEEYYLLLAITSLKERKISNDVQSSNCGFSESPQFRNTDIDSITNEIGVSDAVNGDVEAQQLRNIDIDSITNGIGVSDAVNGDANTLGTDYPVEFCAALNITGSSISNREVAVRNDNYKSVSDLSTTNCFQTAPKGMQCKRTPAPDVKIEKEAEVVDIGASPCSIELDFLNGGGEEIDIGACFLAHTRLAILYHNRSKDSCSGINDTNKHKLDADIDNGISKCDDNVNNNDVIVKSPVDMTDNEKFSLKCLQHAERAATIAVRIFYTIFDSQHLGCIAGDSCVARSSIQIDIQSSDAKANSKNNDEDMINMEKTNKTLNYSSYITACSKEKCKNLKLLNEIMQRMFCDKQSSRIRTAHVKSTSVKDNRNLSCPDDISKKIRSHDENENIRENNHDVNNSEKISIKNNCTGGIIFENKNQFRNRSSDYCDNYEINDRFVVNDIHNNFGNDEKTNSMSINCIDIDNNHNNIDINNDNDNDNIDNNIEIYSNDNYFYYGNDDKNDNSNDNDNDNSNSDDNDNSNDNDDYININSNNSFNISIDHSISNSGNKKNMYSKKSLQNVRDNMRSYGLLAKNPLLTCITENNESLVDQTKEEKLICKEGNKKTGNKKEGNKKDRRNAKRLEMFMNL